MIYMFAALRRLYHLTLPLPFDFHIKDQKSNPGDVEDQKQRHKNDKFNMFCFVTEDAHAKPRTEAAAEGCQKDQSALRNPPGLSDSLAFVDPVHNK